MQKLDIALYWIFIKDKRNLEEDQSTISDRKKDHIDLAFKSATTGGQRDDRFIYEPMLATHPDENARLESFFLGKPMNFPIWVSSMTGGTGIAKNINENLARACKDFGLGMGLGSCRKLLYSDDLLEDFAVRPFIGDQPLYANLGIAQLIEQIEKKEIDVVHKMVDKISADGLIIHVNPVQEWMQPEGDKITGLRPIEAIETFLEKAPYPIIVKEVGQGMGPDSLQALMELPIAALEFGAFGGTNFAKLEALRKVNNGYIDPICFVGHTASEMIQFIKDMNDKDAIQCKEFIISGGVADYLDGFYYNELLPFPSVYGQAAGFLKHALGGYDELAKHVQQQTQGYAFAQRYLTLRK